MKAAVLQAPGTLAVAEVPQPVVDPGSVLVRVRACGMCGSDLRIIHHGHPRVVPPAILGHEIMGEIATLGTDVTDWDVGDRVTLTPRIFCGTCWYCQHGRFTHCPQGRSLGYVLPGGFAEALLVPAEGVRVGVLHRVPETVDDVEAALTEPLACCLRAQQQMHLSANDVVVVIGGGSVGLLHVRLARACGVSSCILVERNQQRRTLAERLTDAIVVSPEDSETAVRELSAGRKADAIIVAAGTPAAQELGLRLIGKGGRINFFAGLPPDSSTLTLETNRLHYDEITLSGSHGSAPGDNSAALTLLANGKVHVRDLITQVLPLADISKAVALLEEGGATLKVVLHP